MPEGSSNNLIAVVFIDDLDPVTSWVAFVPLALAIFSLYESLGSGAFMAADHGAEKGEDAVVRRFVSGALAVDDVFELGI